MIGSEKFTNVRLATFSSFLKLFLYVHLFIFILILGLGIALIKEAETEADPEIETKTEEKEDVLLARRRVTKPETAKKHKVEEEEDPDLDLIPGLTEGDTAEEMTHVPILETEEDQEEETLETEDRDLLIPEIEDILETPETVEETIEVWVQDHHLIANRVDPKEDRSQGERPLKIDVQEVDLLVKVILKEEEWKEKVSQEVILKEELKETVLSNKCLKVK